MRRGTIFVLAFLLLILVPSPADASSASFTRGEPDPNDCGGRLPSTTRYIGGPEINKTTVVGVRAGVFFSNPEPGPCSHFSMTVGEVLFFDSATKIAAGGGCTPVIGRLVACALGDNLVIDLGDGDDYLALVLAPEVDAGDGLGVFTRWASINAGGGDDHLRTVNLAVDLVACGPGVDTILADRDDQIDVDCENVSFL